ncbi:MAG: PEP-CTERM sorting domain-containing protein [Rhodoferax sp.]|nr:PEP-CTERM sorting domain-containing protein [Rhodoferax sp.]MDZ7921209.1 PEP-CTERM sorting domain-containing protein [Rhodoferax sp.]
MKKIFAATIFTCVTVAQAATFNYTFNPAPDLNVFGSFEGTASGDLVTNLSNITLSANFRGDALNTGARVLAYSYNSPSASWVSGGSVASFSGSQNNFAFLASTHDIPTSPPYGFEILFSTESHKVYFFSSYSQYAHRGWQLTEVTAVPEPESYALMLAGLGLMAGVARRHKLAKAA